MGDRTQTNFERWETGHRKWERIFSQIFINIVHYWKKCPANQILLLETSKARTFKDEESDYPGNWYIEEKIRHHIRWNALITVLKANKKLDLGGHISTYSSAATLYEVGFNHFFRGGKLSDMVYFQGHSSPGIYARSFLEDLISEQQLDFHGIDTQYGKHLNLTSQPYLYQPSQAETF